MAERREFLPPDNALPAPRNGKVAMKYGRIGLRRLAIILNAETGYRLLQVRHLRL
ncbi:hypothetical protein DaDZ19_02990 [Dickeya ananatis]